MTAPLALLVTVLLDTAVIVLFAQRPRFDGWKLVGVIFVLFYGVKTLLVGIEVVYFSEILTPAMARGLFINGLIVAALFSPTAVWVLGRWTTAGKASTAGAWKSSSLELYRLRWTNWRWSVCSTWFYSLAAAGALF